jgi:hypothetical protein
MRTEVCYQPLDPCDELSLELVSGVHPRVVMETLGHSQISLTLDTYSHVLPALQQEAARQIDTLLSAEG